MPWTSRRRHTPRARLRRGLRRWRYDHSEDLRAFWIGAGVVAATLAVLLVLKVLA